MGRPPNKIHARHIHIRAPELLLDEFQKAIEVMYRDHPRKPTMSEIFRGLMFGFITDRVTLHADPLDLEAEMYRQEKIFFFEEQDRIKKNLFASNLREK